VKRLALVTSRLKNPDTSMHLKPALGRVPHGTGEEIGLGFAIVNFTTNPSQTRDNVDTGFLDWLSEPPTVDDRIADPAGLHQNTPFHSSGHISRGNEAAMPSSAASPAASGGFSSVTLEKGIGRLRDVSSAGVAILHWPSPIAAVAAITRAREASCGE
jgi:hypothetical protein